MTKGDDMTDEQYKTEAKTVYLAGPMSGYEDFNYPLFNATAELLRESGFIVDNPAEMQHNLDAAEKPTNEPGSTEHAKTLARYMRLDLPYVIAADAIALLPGWEESRGSNIELLAALATGSEVWEFFEAVDGSLALAYSDARPNVWLVVSTIEGML